MARRSKRRNDEDFDDSLETMYFSKRMKTTTGEGVPTTSMTTTTTTTTTTTSSSMETKKKKEDNDDDGDEEEKKLDRVREKNKRRKERRKIKAEERLQRQKTAAQERKAQAIVLNEKRQESKERKEKKMGMNSTSTSSSSSGGGEYVKSRKGVQYQDVVVGKGPEVQLRKQVQVKYTLRGKPDNGGRVIDSSKNFGFKLGQGDVIQGWDIGMEGMRQGGIRNLIVPPQAGYGQKDIGAGVGANLYFQISLLAC